MSTLTDLLKGMVPSIAASRGGRLSVPSAQLGLAGVEELYARRRRTSTCPGSGGEEEGDRRLIAWLWGYQCWNKTTMHLQVLFYYRVRESGRMRASQSERHSERASQSERASEHTCPCRVGQVHLGDESVAIRTRFPEVSWFGRDHMCLSVGVQNLDGHAHKHTVITTHC